MSSVEERLKRLQHLVSKDEVCNEASFVDDLGADSLDTVELVMALEEDQNQDVKMRKRKK